MKKQILILCIVLFLLPGLSLAGSQALILSDMAGRKVEIPFDPDRIICLGPGTLRLIVYLNAQSKVTGVEDMEKRYPGGRPYWIANPQLADLPRCGPGGPGSINKKPDLEAVLAAKPQVIFVTYMEATLADEVQSILGIPVVVLSYGAFSTFDEAVYDALRIAGNILNRKDRAEEVIAYIEALRHDMSRRTRNISQGDKPSVYVGGIGYRGVQGIESTEKRFIPFDWVGADNVAQKVPSKIGSHVAMDKEVLLKLNPQVIFIDSGGLGLVKADIRKKPEYYQALQGFSSKQVYLLHPFNWYTTNIGTALSDAYAIGKILYPKEFEDIVPEQKADEIYTFLVGRPAYAVMKGEYGALGAPANF
ncbi:iron ABC transporter substrate-binding protein [Desulfobacter postgatei]|uniref:iron ABC transporter substrate-binding protein n=1 Tax=Desulfobacter postgatei TaxID=2293 RepID=UPI00259BCAF6|nr:iron ABC transporter substrate-binding protein [uncultured Desulfobacter sp.]